MISALLMGVALIAGWLSWRMFTYQVLPDQLVISRGIIHRSRRSIPAQRIQDVSIKQGVLARLIGLAEVRIETGGGEKDEGRLDSVSLAEAHRLRELLRGMSRAAAAPATVTPLSSDADEPILFQLGFGRLLFFGLFRFSLLWIAAILGAAQYLDQALDLLWRDPDPDTAGWVLMLAPIGVLGLAISLGAKTGADAIGGLAHYIVIVSAAGLVVLLASVGIALTIGRRRPGAFAKAMLPVYAVAISTQSSLASLPAMLAASRKLGVRESTADFVLPLAVAIFRGTSPAMNMGVAIYAAYLTGTPLSPWALGAGVLVAFLVSLSSVSLPGTLSFVVSVGPIAMAMGVPIEPLALLVAVEMLPDIMRTLGNVTADVAVTTAVDKRGEAEA
jgi:hypothetical protein